jgi:uroporphyrinogen-III synthase
MGLDLSPYDALIFSSKNGVKAISKINQKWKDIPSYAIGIPTSNFIQKEGGQVAYVSHSAYGNDFAKELVSKLKGKKVLFLRAQVVLSDLEAILKSAGIDLTSQVVYETTCKEQVDVRLKENSVFIFTSPSTVECFFEHYEWRSDYKAVCIGDVTAKSFPIDISLHVSKIQTIPACIELAKTLE